MGREHHVAVLAGVGRANMLPNALLQLLPAVTLHHRRIHVQARDLQAYGLVGRVGELVIANRTASRAERLAREAGVAHCPIESIAGIRPDVLVNTTSVGMHPNVDDSPAPPEMLREGMVVFDAVYNPIETRLLREARAAGCVTASGFEWFVGQAAGQFETWTGRTAPREVMAEVVRRRLTDASQQ